jgi:hypothetical protein|tara:strand:+ start:693 stop:995 length:303 start_codon:yes stop_codon:yes gene_type:complete
MEKEEEQKDTNSKFQRGGSITVSTTIKNEVWTAARDHSISWAKAMELGIKVALNEIDPETYPAPDCVLSRKIVRLSEILTETSGKLAEYEEKEREKIKLT